MAQIPPPEGYPVRYEADVVLADGGTVHIRPIRPNDATRLAELHGRLSAETVYLRFFSPLPALSPKMLERFVNVDYVDRLALVAELGHELIAVARYDRLPDDESAEVAFVVDDAHQGRGIGILLLEHLAAAGSERGIRRFVAETLPTNDKMLKVFHAAGFGEERRFAEGVVQVSFSIEPTDTSLAAMHGREQRAAARSVERLLRPSTIAVIGASRDPSAIGHTVFTHLLAGGFTGVVYPVNPGAHAVASVRAYPTVMEVPDAVDVAVVIVPADQVDAVVDDCARKHVSGLMIVSSGFADAGPTGAEAERRLVAHARGLGMRVLGPNSMGAINTAPDVCMNTTFAAMPPRGRIGFLSQSGALGVAILDTMARRGLGVSTFVATGNKADISGNDLLQYWDDDPDTDLVLLYLESFGNPRTFARVARRVARGKPILAVKSGRGAGGPDRTEEAVEALFGQTGVIRVDTLEQLFDVAEGLISQPLPGGRRVAIVGNAGGPGLVAADACRGSGLEVAGLVELPLSATGADYRRELGQVLADDGVDAVIVFFVPPVAGRVEEIGAAIAEQAAGSAKPVLANFLTVRGAPSSLEAGGRRIPSYAFPESAALALGHMAARAEWLRRPVGHLPDLPGVHPAEAAALLAGRDGWLEPDMAREVLAAYRIPGRRPEPAGNAGNAGNAGDAVGAIPAVELSVSVHQDRDFGPLVTLTLGRTAPGGTGDRASRILPLTDVDAGELTRSLRGSALLLGGVGTPPVDVAALEDLLLRVGRLVEDLPEVAELVLDPVMATASGVSVLGVRLRVAAPGPGPQTATRRLR